MVGRVSAEMTASPALERTVTPRIVTPHSGTTFADLLPGVLAAPTPFLFFTGKGGVGKTSCAAAAAVALADAGARVLIVSTDPASNLAEVFAMTSTSSTAPEPVPGVDGLDVLAIDPVEAAAQYRERVIGPYRAALPASAIASIEEELSGSCTVEVAAFNEFVALLTDPEVTETYDHVVFDTAPTGHTLRLLALPAAWTGFLETNTSGVTCVGPVSALGQAQESYADSLAALRDPALTTVVLVARPEASSLAEAARASRELADLGMTAQRVVLNGALPEPTSTDPVALAWYEREQTALAELPPELRGTDSTDVVPLLADAPVGIAALRTPMAPGRAAPPEAPLATGTLARLVEDIAAGGPGIVMTMGKGGVGKTTVAAAIALALSDRGLPVTLTTTDPAAHVQDILPDAPTNLVVTRIDPALETEQHCARVLGEAGRTLDAEAMALLAEDLRSPCTEEVAVFHAFARTVAGARDRYVVIDTAPTGHTLLLLQSSQSFAAQSTAGAAGGTKSDAAALFGALTDASFTRILLVTLGEATPVHEAFALRDDLARAGLTPYAWVVNAALSATTTTDPVLLARAGNENRWIAETAAQSARPPVVLPWVAVAPRRSSGLRHLVR